MTPADSTQYLASVFERYADKKSPEERERTDQTKKTKSIFSLLTASIGTDPLPHLKPGTLSSSFESVLDMKNKTGARENLADGILETVSAMRDTGHVLSLSVTLSRAMFVTPLTEHLRMGQLYPSTFVKEDLPRSRVNVLSFLTPTSEVDSRSRADSEAASHAAVGNDTKKIMSNHELFTGGKLHGLLDVKSLLASVLAFLT